MEKIRVIISNQQKAVKIPTGIRMLIRRCCHAVLQLEGFKDSAEISVSFVDNDQIQEMNRQYRNIDAPTDVLSFPMGENGNYDVNHETGAKILGDIVISVPKAMEQAKTYGHSFEREMGFLTAHSMLHLLGYDHEAGGLARVRMRSRSCGSWACLPAPATPPRPVHNPSPQKKRRLWHSFADAFRGIGCCIKSERNMRIHLVACAYVLFFASQLSLSRGEMACLLLAIGGVMTAETLNTALEKLCDFAQKNLNRYIRVIKDMAAGAVLLSAIAALLVGVVILFRPELWALLWGIVSHPAALGLLALSLAVAAGFIFLGPAWVAERWDALRRRRLDRGRREK